MTFTASTQRHSSRVDNSPAGGTRDLKPAGRHLHRSRGELRFPCNRGGFSCTDFRGTAQTAQQKYTAILSVRFRTLGPRPTNLRTMPNFGFHGLFAGCSQSNPALHSISLAGSMSAHASDTQRVKYGQAATSSARYCDLKRASSSCAPSWTVAMSNAGAVSNAQSALPRRLTAPCRAGAA
jgi:hypothetical protein